MGIRSMVTWTEYYVHCRKGVKLITSFSDIYICLVALDQCVIFGGAVHSFFSILHDLSFFFLWMCTPPIWHWKLISALTAELEEENLFIIMEYAHYMDFEDVRVPQGVHTKESLHYAWKEFETRDDDVFNITYPKSGTTWLQEILSLIYSNGDAAPVKSTFSWDRVPWLEQHGGRAQLENRPSPRLITTHLPFHLFPQSFAKSKAKAIYTIRNPKDVCVSLYYFSKIAQFMESREDFQDFVSLFLSKDIIFGRWFEHVKGWLTIKDNPNFLVLSYEDMLKDLRSNVIKISKFLGKELDDVAIDSVVEHSSFQEMKNNPMSNYSAVPNEIFNKEHGTFHRKGIAGDHKNHFTPAQEEEFERIYKDCMKDINFSFA